MAHFGQEGSSDITDFVVPEGWIAPHVADHSMVVGVLHHSRRTGEYS